MKMLILNSRGAASEPNMKAFRVDGLQLNIAYSLEEGVRALQDDQFDSVISDAVWLGETGKPFRSAFQATQSPACHFVLGISPDEEIPVDVLVDGVDGYVEFPLSETVLQDLILSRRKMDQDILQQRSQLHHRDEEIATLVAISNIITSNLEFIPLLAAIAQETSKALEADRTTIFMYHAKRDELEAAYAEGLGPYSITLPSSQGIVGHVALSCEMLNVTEAHQSPYFHDKIDQQTGYTTHTVLCGPLISPKGDLIGVAECLNKRDGFFTKTDERILNMLSPLFAVAIENALMYRDLQEQVRQNERMTAEKIQAERLAVVGRLASAVTKDIAEPMEKIVGHAAHLGRENLTPEERENTCQAIERIVDYLVDMAQELLDFSRGSLELAKEQVRIQELANRMDMLLEDTTIGRIFTMDTTVDPAAHIVIDLDKFTRALSRIIFALNQLGASSLSVNAGLDSEGMRVTITPLSSPQMDTFMSLLDQPFSNINIDHDMGLKIAVANRVVESHGGTFVRQANGLEIRTPARSTGG